MGFRAALSLGLVLSCFNVSPAQADDKLLTDLEIYKRCYVRMVREVPQATDPLLRAVQAGTKTGATACLNLFDMAAFEASGTSYVLKNRNDETSIRVLKTFNDLHISWFSNKSHTFDAATTSLFHDLEEPALYFTRAAFAPNVQFSSIVTHDQSLSGLRDRPATDTLNLFRAQRFYSHSNNFPYSGEPFMVVSANTRRPNKSGRLSQFRQRFDVTDESLLVQVGRLKGVRSAPKVVFGDFVVTIDAESDKAIIERGLLGKMDINEHMGAGIVGSQGFLKANANLVQNQRPTDVSLINRRITSKMYEDLLCLQLPTLLDDDVRAEVNLGSTHTFQRSTSCMRCHSSIDDSAFTMRNLMIYKSSANANVKTQVDGRPISGFARLPVVATSTNYTLQAPTGHLHYRENITGNRISVALTKLSDVGEAFKNGNDIYNCAAKRYYRFFTGVDVSLAEKATKTVDKYHQDIVLKLGEELKTSQSVRKLMNSIFKSEPFQSRNYKSEAAQ